MPNPVPKSRGEKGKTRVETIYGVLFQAIFAQELRPGTKLSEDEIGAVFNVSRTIVRAALNRLHSEALVEFKQNRGAFVASPTTQEAREVFDARLCIEREVMTRLAPVVDDTQLQLLEEHIRREELAINAGQLAESIQLSGKFHLLAARMAGNDVLLSFLRSLTSRSSLILALHSARHESDCSVDEHVEIVAALRTHDAEAASRAMSKHLGHVLQRARLDGNEDAGRTIGEILSHFG